METVRVRYDPEESGYDTVSTWEERIRANEKRIRRNEEALEELRRMNMKTEAVGIIIASLYLAVLLMHIF